MLGSIFTILGVFVILLGLCGFVFSRFFAKHLSPKVGPVVSSLLIAVGLVIAMLNGMIYYAEPGYNYLVQYPLGTQIGETLPGYHLKWWGSAVPFKKFITVKAAKNLDTSVSASIDPIIVRFTDAATSDVSVTARFQLPSKQEDFLNLAISFRTQENLINATLIPSLQEVVRNAARTLTAQDYIAGKGGEFENAIFDQLQHGTYLLNIREIHPQGKQKVAEPEVDRTIDQSQLVRYEVDFKKTQHGEIMRKPLAIQEYNISVRQSNVANVEPEQKFKEMLAKQRDAAAEASIKKQEAKRAEYEKQKIIAEGEAEKARIKVDKEKEQIEKLITAETAKKEAQIALEEAKILKLKEIELAEKIKIAADAQSYQKRKVLEADGALEMKLATIEKIAEKISQGWASRQVPQTVIITGEQENTSQYTGSPQEIQIMLGMMLAEMAKNQLSTDLSIPKGRTAQ